MLEANADLTEVKTSHSWGILYTSIYGCDLLMTGNCQENTTYKASSSLPLKFSCSQAVPSTQTVLLIMYCSTTFYALIAPSSLIKGSFTRKQYIGHLVHRSLTVKDVWQNRQYLCQACRSSGNGQLQQQWANQYSPSQKIYLRQHRSEIIKNR